MTISNGGAVPEGVRFPLPPCSGELSATMKVSRPSNRQTGTLDSSLENRRQEEFNNRGAEVRRRVDRRSVGWLCRRGGRRLRVCWPAGVGGRDGGGSGYWRAGRRGVCERTGRGARPRPSPGQALNAFGGETIGVAGAVALQQPVAFELAQVVAELI